MHKAYQINRSPLYLHCRCFYFAKIYLVIEIAKHLKWSLFTSFVAICHYEWGSCIHHRLTDLANHWSLYIVLISLDYLKCKKVVKCPILMKHVTISHYYHTPVESRDILLNDPVCPSVCLFTIACERDSWIPLVGLTSHFDMALFILQKPRWPPQQFEHYHCTICRILLVNAVAWKLLVRLTSHFDMALLPSSECDPM